jgi:hypothetical protein
VPRGPEPVLRQGKQEASATALQVEEPVVGVGGLAGLDGG